MTVSLASSMTVSLACCGWGRSALVVPWLAGLVVAVVFGSSCVDAQQVAISTPLQIANDRFFGGGGARLFAEQGSRRSFTSQVPTLVVPNGGTGAIFSGSLRPFVVGVVPVVGGGYAPVTAWPQGLPWAASPIPPGPSFLQQRLAENWEAVAAAAGDELPFAGPEPAGVAGNADVAGKDAPLGSSASSAQHGDLSVAEILRQREDSAIHGSLEVRQLVQRGRLAEAEGKRAAARVFYQMAARRAPVEERAEILQQLREVSHSSADDVDRD